MARSNRHTIVSALMAEYQKQTGEKYYIYPRSNMQLDELKAKLGMLVETTPPKIIKNPRAKYVRELLDRYYTKTGKHFAYPRSNKQLEELRKALEELHGSGRYNLQLIQSQMDGVDKTYVWKPTDDVQEAIPELIQEIYENNPQIKLVVTSNILFKSAVDSKRESVVDLVQPIRVILSGDDINEISSEIADSYRNDIEVYTGVGSGWVFEKLNYLKFDVFKYDPLRAGKYVELPDSIKASQCCINIKTLQGSPDDDKCFIWCVLVALHPQQSNPNRVSHYRKYLSELNLDGFDFPIKLTEIDRFVRKNENIIRDSINVFSLDDDNKMFPVKISSTGPNAINLLMFDNHFAYIKNFNGLAGKQFTKHKEKTYFCVRCLAGFCNNDDLLQHHLSCFYNQRERFPKEEKKFLKFKNINSTLYQPVIAVYDFESLLVPCEKNSLSNSRCVTTLNKHIPVAASYKICSNDPKFDQPIRTYRKKRETDEDPAVWLVRNLIFQVKKLLKGKAEKQPYDKQAYRDETACHICSEPFTENPADDKKKCRSFCKVTGQYRGAAHFECRKKYQQKSLPAIAHNACGYDHHFIILALSDPQIKKLIGNGEIKGIPTHTEKFTMLCFRKVKFFDSMQFMSASLDQLAKNCSSFPTLEKHFGKHSEIMKKKGIFPYEYITDYGKLHETKLPEHKHFYSALNGENVSVEDYNRALTTFKELQCGTIGEYLDMYLQQDVALLCDIVEEFRKSSLAAYGLDPCWYVSSPGLAWDSMLKMTGQTPTLLTDSNKHHFVECAMRGGISVITKKKATANNKYLPDYNPNDPSSFLVYLDANNLYGWAMSEQCRMNARIL